MFYYFYSKYKLNRLLDNKEIRWMCQIGIQFFAGTSAEYC